MRSIIISVGDELVSGQTVDTNSAWMSQRLAAAGCAVQAHIVVADDQQAIEQAIRRCAGECDVLIISGGIGPTPDDLTRQALAGVLGQPLEMNESWLRRLEDFFRQRRRPMPEMNRIQAMIPRGAELIENCCGTAAGIHAVLPGGCHVFVLPGVPKEMSAMFEQAVLPFVRQRAGGAVVLLRALHTFGPGESAIAEMLGSALLDRRRNPLVGTTVSGGVVTVRIYSRHASADEARRQMEDTAALCRRALGDLIFGEDDRTLPQAVADLLREHALARRYAPAVCTAESCTGGLVAKYLTDVPGSSTFFRQGWVTYSNEAKVRELNVPPEIIERHGAVSEQTACAMALGAARRSGAVFALALSGIAGPDGGTPQKPVGMVCIALASPAHGEPAHEPQLRVQARTFYLPGDRETVRDRAAKMALTMLRYRLLEKDMPF